MDLLLLRLKLLRRCSSCRYVAPAGNVTGRIGARGNRGLCIGHDREPL